jgi:hypothetical protein
MTSGHRDSRTWCCPGAERSAQLDIADPYDKLGRMQRRDPRFERDNTAPEWVIKSEMERLLREYFHKKHGEDWHWCEVCLAWCPRDRHRITHMA